MTDTAITDVVGRALAEDIGSGDVTSALIPADQRMTAYLLVKADGVIAGLAVAETVFAAVDETVVFEYLVEDGTAVHAGTRVARISGPARAILTAERTALNFMQRMSGIATATRRFVEAVAGTNAKILDTRKTAPGLRRLDKWAVRLGGGVNHRMGLYDMILIKDNHVAAAGGVVQAVEQVRALPGSAGLPIEVEVTDLRQLELALPLGVERILLDNMTPDQMQMAVEMTMGRVPLEASGNVNLDTLRAIAETGVDYISSGALTHSVRALDISLEAVEEGGD